MELGRYPEAVKDVSGAIKMDPECPESYMTRATAFLMLNHPNEALTNINKAIAIRPSRFNLYVIRAVIHIKQNHM